MDFNAYSHFSQVPSVDIERSRFRKPYSHKTTFNAGDLVPFYIEDALPASTYEIDTSLVCRMTTPIFPVMDNAYLDLFYFFVPYRLLWDHWREFNGENRNGYWTQRTDYYVPHLNSGTNGFEPGSVADHFGFPIKIKNLFVSQFPFRAYCMIWNEWFRNQNTDNPTYCITSDEDLINHPDASALYGGSLLQVCREHDYFSDCLPQPQKMEPVTIPMTGNAPVVTSEQQIPYKSGASPMEFYASPALTDAGKYSLSVYHKNDDGTNILNSAETAEASPYKNILWPSNLYADLSGVTAATINDLRMAFATQRYAERLAYGGSRYIEQLNTFYGLTSQDARLQRPEFLGSDRIPINVTQVLQTSATTTTSPQGNTAAYSLTSTARRAPITYSTQEHGIIMGLMCVRHTRSYQQGIHREWSRRELFDFYQPTFAHLGNQPVLNKEIFAGENGDEVFGYQEAWGEYRYKPSDVTGEFRSAADAPLDAWHYADYYESTPILSEAWMREGKTEIGRTLAVKTHDQFLADIYVNTFLTAPMPLYSVPGLLDHF